MSIEPKFVEANLFREARERQQTVAAASALMSAAASSANSKVTLLQGWGSSFYKGTKFLF